MYHAVTTSLLLIYYCHDNFAMGSITERETKNGKKYRVQVCINGRREYKTFKSKMQAKAWMLEREVEIKSGKSGISNTHTLADMFYLYADTVSPGKRGARWEFLRLNNLAKDKIGSIKLQDVSL